MIVVLLLFVAIGLVLENYTGWGKRIIEFFKNLNK